MTSAPTTATQSQHNRNVSSEAAFSESREVRSWQRYRLGASLLDLIDEAFAQHRQWRETQDRWLTPLGLNSVEPEHPKVD